MKPKLPIRVVIPKPFRPPKLSLSLSSYSHASNAFKPRSSKVSGKETASKESACPMASKKHLEQLANIKREEEPSLSALAAVEGEMRKLSRNLSKNDKFSPKLVRPKNPLAKVLDDDEFSLENCCGSLMSTEESECTAFC
eukprot:TRINITY_DN9508_c0_g1_i8.p1 TRINITY_DN9508_c0_g1~~TRINITY_DN9508_c0_g1_i8.p1  ORF type:complete len:140 (+),score=20.63 TRINITY_DN9508_c0_g1_i8:260-679(+)